MEGFYGQKQEGTRSGLISLIFLRGMEGSVWQITSLKLSRKFQIDWLRLHSWKEVERVVTLGMKTWFGDVSLAQVIPFGSVVHFLTKVKSTL